MFISYFLYGLGIVWAIFPVAKQNSKLSFGTLLMQGLSALSWLLYLWLYIPSHFIKANPETHRRKGSLTKPELLKTEKNRTPAEIDTMIENGKRILRYFWLHRFLSFSICWFRAIKQQPPQECYLCQIKNKNGYFSSYTAFERRRITS